MRTLPCAIVLFTHRLYDWFTNRVKKMLPGLTLVLGGAASGKSAFAENLLLESDLDPVYIATGRVTDAEMGAKIKLHQIRRGPEWRLLEEPGNLSKPLAELGASDGALLDCATMWLSNRLMAHQPLDEAAEAFMSELSNATTPVIVVSNEVGQGIVPENKLARQFREAQGRLNIAVAARADLVVQVIAGLPNVLKGNLP